MEIKKIRTSILIVFCSVFNLTLFAQSQKSRSYKYREIEKQSSQSLTINIGDGGLSGLTIDRRYVKDFANQLPSREDFKPEVKRSMRRVK